MNFILAGGIVIAVTVFFGLTFLAACAIATRIVFQFRWRAILGFERQFKKKQSVAYVSRAVFMPVGVFWLGGKDWQENAVAQAMANGTLKLIDVHECVSQEHLRESIKRHVPVWPSREAKQLLGKPEDIAA